MTCNEVNERLIAALDAGESCPEADRHCLSCPSCAESRTALLKMFEGLDELPSPDRMSGDEFVRSLPVKIVPEHSLSELWNGLCELISRYPALGAGLALICFLAGMSFSRPVNVTTAHVETQRTLETLTREIVELNEAVALVRLEQASASERLQAVHWIGDHGRSDSDLVAALGGVLERDENVNVRLAAIDALSGFSGDPAVRPLLIGALMKPQSPLVRIALIEHLVPLADPASLAVFKAIAADEKSHEAVRERARTAAQSSI